MRQVNMFVVSLLCLVSAWSSSGSAQVRRCTHPYIFFDLGMTVVDTATNKYNPMFLMPGIREYLRDLNWAGYRVGVISDVPLAWGRDNPEMSQIKDFLTAKWLRMIYFMQGRYPADKTSWVGAPLDFSYFGTFYGVGPDRQFQGRVFLPLAEGEQKSKGGKQMFFRAISLAAQEGCRALYMGEELSEVMTARSAGMSAFWVGHDAGPDPRNFYLPINAIDTWFR